MGNSFNSNTSEDNVYTDRICYTYGYFWNGSYLREKR